MTGQNKCSECDGARTLCDACLLPRCRCTNSGRTFCTDCGGTGIERMYTIRETVQLLGWSEKTVRKMFLREEGVQRFIPPGMTRYKTYIPRSVIDRVLRRISVPAARVTAPAAAHSRRTVKQ